MTPPPSTAAIDVNVENFQKEVVERSLQVPVLIDFWAPWCGPCRALGPVLERLANEMQGRFVLAKVDNDQNPELADAFRIQSVPAVILVAGGRPVDGFVGAQPEPKIREFLAPHLAPAPDPVAEARALEEGGDRAGALALLLEVAAAGGGEGNPLLHPEIARLFVEEGRADEARELLDQLTPEELATDVAKSVRARLELGQTTGDLTLLEAEAQAAPDDLAKQIELGKALVVARRAEEGLEKLLDVAKRDLAFEGGAPRKALLEMFELLGPQDPWTLEFQRRLSILLCP